MFSVWVHKLGIWGHNEDSLAEAVSVARDAVLVTGSRMIIVKGKFEETWIVDENRLVRQDSTGDEITDFLLEKTKKAADFLQKEMEELETLKKEMEELAAYDPWPANIQGSRKGLEEAPSTDEDFKAGLERVLQSNDPFNEAKG